MTVVAQVIVRRLTAQLLAGPPAGDAEGVVQRLLAVQGQDQRGVRLAVRARSDRLTAGDVDRALTSERSLVITWLNRGTMHLVRREDYAWLHALTTPPLFTGNARRLAQEGVDQSAAERGVAAIERSLASEGPLTREQLAERVAATGVRTQGQALVHLLALASLRGLILRGPMIEGRHAYALVADWLGAPHPVDRERALSELARRYLAGHGPASDRDLAKWAGLALRDARTGLHGIASELHQRSDGLVDLAGRPPDAELPPPRLLGSFDPVLLGWTSREALLGGHQGLVTVNGVFRPFALVRGRAVATWRMTRGKIALEPFAGLTRRDEAALEADAADVVRFLAPA